MQRYRIVVEVDVDPLAEGLQTDAAVRDEVESWLKSLPAVIALRSVIVTRDPEGPPWFPLSETGV